MGIFFWLRLFLIFAYLYLFTYVISSVVNRSRWQRYDFSLLWTVVVENSTGSVHHVQKSLNLSHACSERTRLLGLRYIRVSRIFIVIRLTDFYDFICREQKSLTTLRLLSAVNSCRRKLNWFCPSCTEKFKFVSCLFRKNTITWFKIYSCIKNFHRYKIDWFLWFHLSWTEIVDNITSFVCCE